LENEVASVRQTREHYDETHQAINSELTKYQEEIKELRRVYEESQDDLAELKQKFNLKTVDYGNLQAELEKNRSDLHLAQLKVQQLTSADEPATNFNNMEQIVQNNLIKDQHIEELKKTIDQINMERTLNDQKYQNYVISLNQERASLAEQIQQLTVDNQKGSQREESLVKHISELEKQIQQQIQRQHQVESKNQQKEEVKADVVGDVVSTTEEVVMLKEQVAMLTTQLANAKVSEKFKLL
jgi:chromosome segregation protein